MIEWLASRTPEQVASGFYVFFILWAAACLAWGHRTGKVVLWDVVTATDRAGIRRTDGRKLFEAGAFVVMTATFVLLSIVGKLTEWYALIYVGSWVAARGWRDFAQIKQSAGSPATTPGQECDDPDRGFRKPPRAPY